MFLVAFFSQRPVISLMASYLVTRNILVSEKIYELPEDTNSRKLLSCQTQNLLVLSTVKCWYDTDAACFPVTTYHWRRVKLQRSTDFQYNGYD